MVFAMEAEHRPTRCSRAHVSRRASASPKIPRPAAPRRLSGYLAARDPRRDGTLRWVVEQGFEMGRPSILEVEADKKDGKITAVRVGGQDGDGARRNVD